MAKFPCFYCTDRRIGCHSPGACEKWTEYHQQHAEVRQRRNDDRTSSRDYCAVKVNSIRRFERRVGTK